MEHRNMNFGDAPKVPPWKCAICGTLQELFFPTIADGKKHCSPCSVELLFGGNPAEKYKEKLEKLKIKQITNRKLEQPLESSILLG